MNEILWLVFGAALAIGARLLIEWQLRRRGTGGWKNPWRKSKKPPKLARPAAIVQRDSRPAEGEVRTRVSNARIRRSRKS